MVEPKTAMDWSREALYPRDEYEQSAVSNVHQLIFGCLQRIADSTEKIAEHLALGNKDKEQLWEDHSLLMLERDALKAKCERLEMELQLLQEKKSKRRSNQ